MVNRSLTDGDSGRGNLAKTLSVYGVAVPAVVLAVLYAGSRGVNVAFGNVVFLLTLLTLLAAFAVFGMGSGMDAARSSGQLSRDSAPRYGGEQEQPPSLRVPGPARLVLVLVGTTVLGWVSLLAVL